MIYIYITLVVFTIWLLWLTHCIAEVRKLSGVVSMYIKAFETINRSLSRVHDGLDGLYQRVKELEK